MADEVHDVCLIGTGPATLLHGLACARAGQSVVFVDRGKTPGGGWHCPPVFEHEAVELGVHLIENRPRLNAVFRALPGIEFAPASQDFGMLAGRRISMRNARMAMYGALAAKALVKGRWDGARHSARNAFAAVRFRSEGFCYPSGGFSQVLKVIQNLLTSSGGEIRLEHNVKRIVMEDHIRVETDRGDVMARRLVMSSRAHAPVMGAEEHWRGLATFWVGSLLMELDRSPNFGGYVEVLGDRDVKRLRNVSAFLRGETAPSVVVQVRRPHEPVEDNVTLALERMKALGLVPEQTHARRVHFDLVAVTTLPDRSMKALAGQFGSRLTMLRTVDLSDERHPIFGR